MNSKSIGFRLTAWYSGILAMAFIVAGAGSWWAIHKSIENAVDQDLRSRLAGMREFLANQEGGPAQFVEELSEHIALAPSGTQFRICDERGNCLYQSPDAKLWNLPAPATVNNTSTVRANGKSIRLLTASLPEGILQIGIPLDAFEKLLRVFSWTLLLASPLVLIVASVGGYWMSRRALRPVGCIASQATAIGALNLSERIPLAGSDDELDRLSAALNAMLARLEDTFRRMAQFTADASHELRTPAAIIQTTAEVALSRPRTPDEHERAWQLVSIESQRTGKLIDDLLTLARADSGFAAVATLPMDLAECVRDACGEVRVLAETAGLSLEIECPQSCDIVGDSDALRRLFLCLLDNAVKYTPRGGSVRVELRRSGTACLLEISDTGIGIPATELPLIFDRFYRVSTDRSRKTGGAGLGLAIAQWIAQRHCGSITAQSTPGEGSAFLVTIRC